LRTAVDGSLVVGGGVPAFYDSRAFAYDLASPSPTMRDLGTLGGWASATAVEGGLVVGMSSTSASPGAGRSDPFVFDLSSPSLTMQDVGTLGGYPDTVTITDGVVVGTFNSLGYAWPEPHRPYQAFAYDAASPAPTLQKLDSSVVVAADGDRAVGSSQSFVPPANRATVWTLRPSLYHPVVDVAATPSGHGYWVATSEGGAFALGDAVFPASMGTINQPIVGTAATPSGQGYWLVAADGAITFGDAQFFGSTGAIPLNQPIVGMAATPSGQGYWLVAADGGILSFGDARFFGSTGTIRLNQPIVGMAATPSGDGYWLEGADGGIFAFREAPFLGAAHRLR
jgi:hypothetical protein